MLLGVSMFLGTTLLVSIDTLSYSGLLYTSGTFTTFGGLFRNDTLFFFGLMLAFGTFITNGFLMPFDTLTIFGFFEY